MLLGLVALTLAGLGLYDVTSYAVSARERSLSACFAVHRPMVEAAPLGGIPPPTRLRRVTRELLK